MTDHLANILDDHVVLVKCLVCKEPFGVDAGMADDNGLLVGSHLPVLHCKGEQDDPAGPRHLLDIGATLLLLLLGGQSG